ncbi:MULTISPECIES: TCR/Tet family MFS transporter [Phyllobacteriaceae]|jgi:MFS transporter, DHA1 family, tetracycline resistance protein|uniref:Tetracycline resistance MFS efflux pump n=1 Tax=Mesorhizobium hungaricum TaxID=1566387 RepID=A0A1C2DYZ1_9HYPH|nr:MULTISPECIES: tetracycline resistance MFS efflux pump [Mesorhizobium]MBN9234573.1 tetracycline resistance MFS efflux pump [Mesorhizobium sp.]MDQ0328947.1 DHA1 family tetracycline resistance protein-like MFS transporter [Mesorhizobium sp. YL-MeA3-2017]OCX19980.1 tetracycline resistance MFS efflux pump [Mesorhizobium hungaricum]
MLEAKTARRGLILVFTTLLLDIIGFGIIMPVLPAYLQELTGVGVSEAAIEGGWLFFAYAAMQFVFAPVIGGLSDRFGRRPVLLASVLTFSIDNLICAIAWSYPMLFIGRVLAGISGASYSTTSAYIADISNDENRAKNFGLLGIAFGVGFVIGPVLGGLLGTFGPRVPFYFAAGLAFLNFLIALFLLPETLDEKHRRRFEWKRANPVGTLLQMRNYPGIGWIGLVFFLMTLGHMVYPAVWSFVSSYRYGWSETQIGLSLGAFGLCGAIIMATVLPRVIPALGEWRTAAIGLSFTAASAIGYAFAMQGWMIYAVIVAGCLEALADPPLRSLAAGKVPPSAQGELQGAMTSIFSITSIITPLLYTGIFSWFTGPDAPVTFGGAPYVLAAFFLALAVIVFVTKVARPTPKEVEQMHPQESAAGGH